MYFSHLHTTFVTRQRNSLVACHPLLADILGTTCNPCLSNFKDFRWHLAHWPFHHFPQDTPAWHKSCHISFGINTDGAWHLFSHLFFFGFLFLFFSDLVPYKINHYVFNLDFPCFPEPLLCYVIKSMPHSETQTKPLKSHTSPVFPRSNFFLRSIVSTILPHL